MRNEIESLRRRLAQAASDGSHRADYPDMLTG
jgi:hypothetical protein